MQTAFKVKWWKKYKQEKCLFYSPETIFSYKKLFGEDSRMTIESNNLYINFTVDTNVEQFTQSFNYHNGYPYSCWMTNSGD